MRTASIAIVAAVVLFAACKEPTYSKMGEPCKKEENCASGLLCVEGLGATAMCMQACGEKGYGGCPDGWTCAGMARTVVPESALSGKMVDERRVCVPGEDLPPHPSGWWVATDVAPEPESETDISVGTAFRFVEWGYDIVLPNGVYDRRFVAWTRGADHWTGKGRYEETVVPRDDRLAISHPFGSIAFERADAARAAELTALLADAPDIEATCKRALSCCEATAEALEDRCDREVEIGDGRWLRQCLEAIDGFRGLLVSAGKEVPESCAPIGATP